MSKVSLISNLYASRKNNEWDDLRQKLIWLVEGIIGVGFLSKKIHRDHEGKYLNLGCGIFKYEGWVNADYYKLYAILRGREESPDWMLDATRPWKCPNNFGSPGIPVETTKCSS
jgi:hypothetical protein